jgi:hypothetical protein
MTDTQTRQTTDVLPGEPKRPKKGGHKGKPRSVKEAKYTKVRSFALEEWRSDELDREAEEKGLTASVLLRQIIEAHQDGG